MIKANEDFATEVERLSQVEKDQLKEIVNLESKIKNMEEEFLAETSRLDQEHQDEHKNLKTEILHLTQSLDISVTESTKLCAEKQAVEEEISGTIEVNICKGDKAVGLTSIKFPPGMHKIF